jgi:fibronectin type 3 domain-containing protein
MRNNKFLIILLLLISIVGCKKLDISKVTKDIADSDGNQIEPGIFLFSGSSILPPSDFSVADFSSDFIKLKWFETAGADSYKIYRSDYKDEGFVKIGSTRLINYIDEIDNSCIGKTFYYRISAIDIRGKESFKSKSVTAVVSSTDFSEIVSGVEVSKGDGFESSELSDLIKVGNGIKISWKSVSGTKFYRIYRAGPGLTGELNFEDSVCIADNIAPFENSYFDNEYKEKIIPGSIYKYWVAAIDEMNSISGSGDVKNNGSDYGFMPTVPELTYISMGKNADNIKLSWTIRNKTDLEINSFRVYKSSQRSSGYSPITNEDGEVIVFSAEERGCDDKVPAGSKFYYKVSVLYSNNVESRKSSALKGYTCNEGAPVIGRSFAISAAPDVNSPDKIAVKWSGNDDSEVSGFNVYRSGQAFDSYVKLNKEPVLYNAEDKYVFIDDTVEKGVPYFYRVSAVSGILESGLSEGSKGIARAEVYQQPVLNSAVFVAPDIFLNWDSAENIDFRYYTVSYRKESDADYSVSSKIPGNIFSYKILNVEAGTVYNVKVQGYISDEVRSCYSHELSIQTVSAPVFQETEKMVAVVNVEEKGIPLRFEIPSLDNINKLKIYRFADSNSNYEKLSPFLIVDISKDGDSWPDQYVDADSNQFVYFDKGIKQNDKPYFYSAAFGFGENNFTLLSDLKEGYALNRPEIFSITEGQLSDKIILKWNQIHGAEGYKVTVYAEDDSKLSENDLNADVFSFEHPCAENSRFSFTVSAKNSNAEYTVSEKKSGFTVTPDLIKIVHNFSATVNKAGVVSLSWDSVDGADFYSLVKNSADMAEQVIKLDGSITNYLDLECQNGRKYYYSITYTKADVLSLKSEVICGYSLQNPEFVQADDGLISSGVRVSWSSVEAASGYKIQLSEDGETFNDSKTVANSEKSVVIEVNPGIIYHFRVLSVDSEGSSNSGESMSDTGYIIPAVSDLSAGCGDSDLFIPLRWKNPENYNSISKFRVWSTSKSGTDLTSEDWSRSVELISSADNDGFFNVNYIPTVDSSKVLNVKVQLIQENGGEGFVNLQTSEESARGFILNAPESVVLSNYGTFPSSEGVFDGVNGTSVKVSWNSLYEASDNISYKLKISAAMGQSPDVFTLPAVSGAMEQIVNSCIRPGTPYTVTLSAVKEDLVVDGSEHYFIPVFNGPEFIAASIKNGTTTAGAEFKFKRVAGIPDYRVYRSRNLSGAISSWTKVAEFSGIGEDQPEITFKDSKDVVSGVYFYRITGVNGDGFESSYNGTVDLYKLPGRPDNLIPVNRERDSQNESTMVIPMSWDHIPGVDYYKIRFSIDHYSQLNGYWTEIIEIGDGDNQYQPEDGKIKINFTGNPTDNSNGQRFVVPGPIDFVVEPWLSKNMHGASGEDDIKGTSSQVVEGYREITDNEWVKEINWEFFSIASIPGDSFPTVDDDYGDAENADNDSVSNCSVSGIVAPSSPQRIFKVECRDSDEASISIGGFGTSDAWDMRYYFFNASLRYMILGDSSGSDELGSIKDYLEKDESGADPTRESKLKISGVYPGTVVFNNVTVNKSEFFLPGGPHINGGTYAITRDIYGDETKQVFHGKVYDSNDTLTMSNFTY